MTYAYARISSRDQNLDRQLSAFRSFGIPPKHIFCDKKSGKDFERKNYLRLIRKLKCGDLLVIKSIDRLGRSYDLIIEEWSRITNKILADILVLDKEVRYENRGQIVYRSHQRPAPYGRDRLYRIGRL